MAPRSIDWKGSTPDLWRAVAPLRPKVFVRRPDTVFVGLAPADTFRFDSRKMGGDPLESLQSWVDDHFTDEVQTRLAAGFISYDLKNFLPDYTCRRGYEPVHPEIVFHYFNEGIYVNFAAGKAFLQFQDSALRGKVEEALRRAPMEADLPLAPPQDLRCPTFPNYERALARIKEYLEAGDCYQVDFTTRLRFRRPASPSRLFERLLESSNAPLATWIDDTPLHVLSASPEHFLAVGADRIESWPMKGTRHASGIPEQDRAIVTELAASEKDKAEHVMIVDVVRNDLARVCRPGTVHVRNPFSIETFQTVHHMVSAVSGALRPDTGLGDILRAVFPGASVTGAPKIRATEIIDELEDSPRGVYTGAIGIIGSRRAMDLAMGIRTLILNDGNAVYGTGGGIVIDSDARTEYDECAVKTQVLINALFGHTNSSFDTLRMSDPSRAQGEHVEP